MYEMKKGGRYGTGFIDPDTVNEYTWKLEWCRQDVEKNMVEFLKRLNSNDEYYFLTTSSESHCLVLQILFLLTS